MSGVKDYSTTPGSNTTVNGIDVSEGCPPSSANNAIRQMMADTRGLYEAGGWIDWGLTHTYASSTSTTVAGDYTAVYVADRRIRAVGSSTGTIYGKVASSSYSAPNTTINYTWDSGSLSNEALTVSVGWMVPTGNPGGSGTGDLVAANNLSDLASAATARTNLGLAIGTDVLAPNGDGSALTNLPSSADQTARDMAASALALADATGTTGQIGAFYLADPFTSDTLATKTNATYDASNDWYTSAGSEASLASYGVGNQDTTFSVAASGVSFSKFGQYFILSPSASLTKGSLYLSKSGSPTGNATIALFAVDGSNLPTGSALASQTLDVSTLTGSLVLTQVTFASPYAAATGNYALFLDMTGTTSDAGNYVSIGVDGSAPTGSGNSVFYNGSWAGNASFDSIFDVTGIAATNMTLRPTAAALATADPLDVMGYFRFDPVSSVTMGTDVLGKISIDGGSTWATGTWTDIGTLGSGYNLWRLDADVSAQTGSSLTYSIETANAKEVRFKQCAGLVPLY